MISIRVTHLRGGDIVGHVHHMVMVVTEALDFGHNRGLDAGVSRLVGFLMDEDPAAGHNRSEQHFSIGQAYKKISL